MISTLLLVASLAAAQGAISPDGDAAKALTSLPTPIAPGTIAALSDELLLDEPGDGRTWARAATWKASFGPEGLTYIPFFGSDAQRNYPIELDLASVTIAGEPLALSPPTRTRSETEVTLHRGALRDVYHLSNEAVEQTFVFNKLPVRGELALDVAVTTELQMTPDSGGFSFSNELGKVTYGAATAIDALGKTLTLDTAITDGGFRIIVPEDFVASAALPLVVDPILRTYSITSDSRRQISVDVAYEDTNQTFQIVVSQSQSAGDIDVIAVNYNAGLDLLLPASPIDVTSSSWRGPKNASAIEPQMFLCVVEVGVSLANTRLFGRTVHAGTGVRGPQFQISDEWAANPDVGGKGNGVISFYDFMVVWDRGDGLGQDYDIMAQAVDSDSTLIGAAREVDGPVVEHNRMPTISTSSGRPGSANGDNEYMIVWQHRNTPTDHDLRGQVIEYTGDPSGHSQFSVYTFSDSIDADVSTSSFNNGYGAEKHWLVAFERRTGTDYDIFAVVAKDGDADNARNVNDMMDLEQDLDHRDPAIGYDGGDYFVAFQTTYPGDVYEVHWTSLNVLHDDGELRTGVSERRGTFAISRSQRANFNMASYHDGGASLGSNALGEAFAAWVTSAGTPTDTDAGGAIIDDSIPDCVGSQYCDAAENSTGSSAWIRATFGSWSTASSFQLDTSQMPPNSFGFYVVSNQRGFVMNPGGSAGNLCLQGAIGRFVGPGQIKNSGAQGRMALLVSPAALPSPFGTVSAMSGETWNFQTWFRDLGPTSNFSNAISITFD